MACRRRSSSIAAASSATSMSARSRRRRSRAGLAPPSKRRWRKRLPPASEPASPSFFQHDSFDFLYRMAGQVLVDLGDDAFADGLVDMLAYDSHEARRGTQDQLVVAALVRRLVELLYNSDAEALLAKLLQVGL